MKHIEKWTFWIFPAKICKGRNPIQQAIISWLWFHSNNEWTCFPSINTISDECGVSRSGIIKHLQILENDWVIEREKRKKEWSYENDSNIYKIMSFVGSAPETLGGTPKTPGSARGTPQVVHEVHPNQTQLNQTQELYSKNLELNSAIVEWIEYKKEKKDAYKPTGLKSFITLCHKYTPESVIEQMGRAMSSNWKWIIWDNCIKIPKIDKKVDFSNMEKNDIFETIKNNRQLLGQLEYQNPKAYDAMKYIFNVASQYGC